MRGGASNDGTVFSLPIGGGTINPLATFTDGPEGGVPVAGLLLSGTNLYGTADQGAGGAGTVFSVPVSGGSITPVATFNGVNGSGPTGDLLLAGSTLYGMTGSAGAHSDGTVFSVPVGGGNVTLLASFNGTDGASPDAGLTLIGTTLYGTTQLGGANGNGTVFSIPTSAVNGTPTVLASFDGLGGNGSQPHGSLLYSGNALYGTTYYGGANGDGTVLKLGLGASPVISITSAAPGTFGSSLGNLTITGGNGTYAGASKTFTATATGYVATSAWNPTTDKEIYALDIADLVSGNPEPAGPGQHHPAGPPAAKGQTLNRTGTHLVYKLAASCAVQRVLKFSG